MKFSLSTVLPLLMGASVLAAPAPVPAPADLDVSANVNALNERQVQLWVWACDGANFSPPCAAVQNVNLNSCYSWASLFPGIGNGSFKTNANVFFHDGNGCTGTPSNRVCNTEISRGNYWYSHTNSFNVFSTKAACTAPN